jgi:alanine racemase
MSEASPSSRHPATAWVNLDRIRDNFKALRSHAGARAVIPVLKANAYGHGAIEVARALDPLGVLLFAVAYVDEAIALRQAGIVTPILVLTGFAPEQLGAFFEFQLTPAVSTPEQVKALAALPHDEDRAPLSVHVKVDTGMSRLGFRIPELEPAIHRLEDAEGIRIEGLMTHLASADEDEVATARQLDLFDEAIMRLETLGVRPSLVHAANSAGMACTRKSHTAVRPGLLLYGVAPRPLSPLVAVKPAMELRARVALVKKVSAGTKVSYGGRFVAGRDTLIATINAGYADGIPRTDAMRTKGALRHGRSALPVAGTVCMDLTMLDATDTPTLAAGDEVTVFGDAPGAWDLAEWAGTNAWQILTSVGARVPRRYTGR